MDFLRQTLNILADLLIAVIFLRVILSWFVRDPSQPLMRALIQVTEPILDPLRRSLPRLGMLDLSPIIAYFLIQLLRSLINNFL